MTAGLWAALVSALLAVGSVLWFFWWDDAPLRVAEKVSAATDREWEIARRMTAADRDWLAEQHRIATGQEPPLWLDNRYHESENR